MMKKVLLIDNYDSFVYNLYQYLASLGATVEVYRNDELSLEAAEQYRPSHIVLSPGPGHPQYDRDIGISGTLLQSFMHRVPILGVCLGCQTIAHALGGKVVQAPSIVHGKTDTILHDGTGLFQELSPEIEVMRYHSLMVEPETLPQALRITAQTKDGIIMALAHQDAPLVGVQFHPESIGTAAGQDILKNFLAME